MYPIFINRNTQGLDFNEFIDTFFEICKNHQLDGRASAFAFIIYDFNNPHLYKILTDKDYWESLNRLSGNYLTIFSLFEQETKNKIDSNVYPKFIKLKFEAVKVETKKDISLSYKQIIETFFGSIEFKTPSILFFQVKDEIITDHFFVGLKENKIEEGFLELQQFVKESVKSIQQISPDNKENYSEIFKMLEISVNSAVWWKKAAKTTKTIVEIKKFFGLFK
jgi:hypothetical protein